MTEHHYEHPHRSRERQEAKLDFLRYLVIFIAGCCVLGAFNAILFPATLWSLWPIGIGALLMVIKGLRAFRADPWDISKRQSKQAEDDMHRGMRPK